MTAKTLNSAQPMVLQAGISHSSTYSIAPGPTSLPRQEPYPSAVEIDSFLEGENPLGCIRGVMLVMAFNVAVFLVGLIIWQSVKFFL
jgi:hypothetical protein